MGTKRLTIAGTQVNRLNYLRATDPLEDPARALAGYVAEVIARRRGEQVANLREDTTLVDGTTDAVQGWRWQLETGTEDPAVGGYRIDHAAAWFTITTEEVATVRGWRAN